jgi:hypothetical protein
MGREDISGSDEEEAGQEHPDDDPAGKPTIDEPTGPALEPGPDEFDRQDPQTE